MSGLPQAVRQEILDLHALFARWLGPGDGDLGDVGAVLAPDFQLIAPDGRTLTRDLVLQDLAAAVGGHGRSFAIEITDLSTLPVGPDHVLAVYVERQTLPERTTSRRSSALFRQDAGAPRGVVWLHLHETWL